MADVSQLRPGWAHRRSPRGRKAYAGVLRIGEAQQWCCPAADPHFHFTPNTALRCAADELERRRAGARVVLHLLHCAPCGSWHDPLADGPGAGQVLAGECPACAVPGTWEKLMVLEVGEVPNRGKRN